MNKFSVFVLSCVFGIVVGWITYLPLQDKVLALSQVLEDDYVNVEKQGVVIEKIVTNLKDKHYGSVSFQLIGSSKDAAKEIKKREFQIRSFVIDKLSSTTKEQFQQDPQELESSLKDHMNDILERGEVLEVYLTEKIIQ